MTSALALLLGTVLVSALGHRALLLLTRSVRVDPHVVMVAWLSTSVGVVVTAITGVIFMGVPGHGGLAELLGRLDSCWSALTHGAVPSWEQSLALAGASILTAITARLSIVAIAQTRVRRARRDKYRFLLTRMAGNGDKSEQTVWLESTELLAFSLSGHPGIIVASQGLRQRLPPRALAATLEHERAHLRGRHQLILDVVDALAAALPIAPLFRAGPIALRELVELAADNAAVRRCGGAAVAEALRAMTTSPDGAHGLAMAGTATARRLARLDSGRGVATGPVRAALGAATAVTMTALPTLVGLALLSSTACAVG